MKVSTICKLMKCDFKTLCKKIRKYDGLKYHIKYGENLAFSGKNAKKNYALFLLQLSDCELKLPVKILDYLISTKVQNETYDYLSCDYHIKVALASRSDIKKRHIDILINSSYLNSAYVLRKLVANKLVDEKTLRENLFKWLSQDGSGAYHNTIASIAIKRINFSEDEIRHIYYNYKDLISVDKESIEILLIHYDKTPQDLFFEFCKSNHYHTRVALVNNIRTPREYLEKSINDTDSWISDGSKRTLSKLNNN